MPISFEVQHPTAGEEVWTGHVFVRVVVTDAPSELASVEARIYEDSTDSNQRISHFKHVGTGADGRIALQLSSGMHQGILDVPRPFTFPADNNRVVLVGGFTGSGELIDDVVQEQSFRLMPRLGVPAKACLFMAFANDSAVGPRGETRANNKPVRIAVPDEATSMTLTVGDQLWRHDLHSSAESDADGRAGTLVLSDAGYLNSDLHSENISHTTSYELNRLVALLEFSESNHGTIVGIGKSPAPIPLPQEGGSDPRPVAVHLGFHDGHEWTNNEGEIEVEVEFNFGSGRGPGPGPVLLAGDSKRRNKA